MAKKPTKAKEPDAEAKEPGEAKTAAAPVKTTARLRPGVDMPVFNPDTGKPLDPEGETVKMSRYWDRQIRRGHAVEVA